MLQVVHVKIIGNISLDGVPQERVVVLPDVESLSLVMSDGEPGYKLAAHISCPSAKQTSFTYEHEKDRDVMTPQETFPASVSWNAIVRQYTRSPVEEVALEMKISSDSIVECSLEFRSPDATVIRLHHALAGLDYEEYGDESFKMLARVYWAVFSQVCRTIRGLTPSTNIKRLRICHTSPVFYRHQTTDEIAQLFESVGPLEELVLHRCDMEAYPASCPGYMRPVVFPPIKELTISHPLRPLDFEAAMVVLAKSQHTLGLPFEHVTVRMDCLPTKMAERLRPWVGAVHCYNEVEPI